MRFSWLKIKKKICRGLGLYFTTIPLCQSFFFFAVIQHNMITFDICQRTFNSIAIEFEAISDWLYLCHSHLIAWLICIRIYRVNQKIGALFFHEYQYQITDAWCDVVMCGVKSIKVVAFSIFLKCLKNYIIKKNTKPRKKEFGGE